jgi:spore maturation protein CgeB
VGCVLLAYDQGAEENAALGFVDMHNLVLYRDIPELREKLGILRADLERAQMIAEAGRVLAQQRYSFAALGRAIADAMRPALRPQKYLPWYLRPLARWKLI